MYPKCKSISCSHPAVMDSDFCDSCTRQRNADEAALTESTQTLSERYPKYYKAVGDLTEIDVYAVHHLFNIQDPSGCIQHSSKKLLLAGCRTGSKSMFKDIREARDTLTRWLQLHQDLDEEQTK